MRIPFSKVYRAFRELDALSDAECRDFVQSSQREHPAGLLATAMAAVVASLAAGIGAAMLTWRLAVAIWGMPQDRAADDFKLVMYVIVIAFSAALSAATVGFLIRDFWLRWAVNSRLRIARCGRCTYSLLGLSVIEDRVKCPECGQLTRLSDRGLTPADILAGARELILRDGVA